MNKQCLDLAIQNTNVKANDLYVRDLTPAVDSIFARQTESSRPNRSRRRRMDNRGEPGGIVCPSKLAYAVAKTAKCCSGRSSTHRTSATSAPTFEGRWMVSELNDLLKQHRTISAIAASE
jgi:hypothetical protein